jgi:hypothetical protein
VLVPFLECLVQVLERLAADNGLDISTHIAECRDSHHALLA